MISQGFSGFKIKIFMAIGANTVDALCCWRNAVTAELGEESPTSRATEGLTQPSVSILKT